MAMHRPISLTHKSVPPFRPNSPDHAHGSRLRERLNKLKADMAREQMLFGNAHVQPHAVEEQAQRTRVSEESQQSPIDSGYESASPSEEAARYDSTNRNGLGIEIEDWGWPGMGTWRGFSAGGSKDESKIQATTQCKTGSSVEGKMAGSPKDAAEVRFRWPKFGSWY